MTQSVSKIVIMEVALLIIIIFKCATAIVVIREMIVQNLYLQHPQYPQYPQHLQYPQ